MGTDIHIHMEYRSRKKKQYRYGGQMYGERLYGVFEVFAGVRLRGKPLIRPRGLPGDVTKVVLQAYHDWKPDCHQFDRNDINLQRIWIMTATEAIMNYAVRHGGVFSRKDLLLDITPNF